MAFQLCIADSFNRGKLAQRNRFPRRYLAQRRIMEDDIEAEVARTVLESHGIDAILFDSGLNSAEGGGMATAVRLMVLEEDLEEATAALASES